MEITETERLMLTKKMEEICGLTIQILAIKPSETTETELKQKVTTILSLINQIASYSGAKNYDLNQLMVGANVIFSHLDLKGYTVAECELMVFCNVVNSIRFNFGSKGLKIALPKKINFNFGSITNK